MSNRDCTEAFAATDIALLCQTATPVLTIIEAENMPVS